ncbi:MAG: Gfo/Idh/MocA family oxidoreductase [Chloroflexota bacterium]|nr:Gfo/Idh/MocA family oxidoreductase [Chloroflexota bacterium]
MTTLRLGVIGCGAVTERYHLPALLASPEVQVVAFVDPTLERARAVAGRVAGAVAAADVGDVAGSFDAVLVAAPNAVHEAVTVPLLTRGIHVLVEKPMARSTAECDRMLGAAEQGGAVLAVGHDFRHFPVARFARDLFAADVPGAVRRVDVRQSAGGRWPYASPAALSREAGGGVLLDFGVHLLDLLLWWFGDMGAIAYRDDAAGGIETECDAELELANGAPVRLELSRTRALRDTVVVECERVTVELGVFEPVLVRFTPRGSAVAMTGGVPDAAFDRAPLAAVFGRQLADFVAAVRGDGPPAVDGRDGRRVVALAEACYAARHPLRQPWDYPEAYAAVGRTGP